MNFEEFCEEILNKVKERFPANEIMLQTATKNNGVSFRGISIREPEGSNMSPTIYLNNYYGKYLTEDFSLESIVDAVCDLYERSKVSESVDMSFFQDFDRVKDSIRPCLINAELNQDLLNNVPHSQYSDLAVVYRAHVNFESTGHGTILIQNSHLAMWDVSIEELHDIAISNLKNDPHDIGTMQDYLNRLMMRKDPALAAAGLDIPEEKTYSTENLSEALMPGMPEMFIATNKDKYFGAQVLLDEDFLEKLSTIIGGYYVLPSSIHEVIILGNQTPGAEIENFDSMVKDVNGQCLDQEDILSNHAYYYDPTMKKLLTSDEIKQIYIENEEEVSALKTI